MISDFVKGKKKLDYSAGIQQGISLHRAIDEFTDNHPANKEAKNVFKSVYGLYAGAFVDVTYDHFLANDTREFSSASALESFSFSMYTILNEYYTILPDTFKRMLPHMQRYNWLYHYRSENGIQQSYGGLVQRAKYLKDSLPAGELLKTNYSLLQHCYDEFFPQLKRYVLHQLSGPKGA